MAVPDLLKTQIKSYLANIQSARNTPEIYQTGASTTGFFEPFTSGLEKYPASRNPDHIKPDSRDIMKRVDEILYYANDVLQPDS